MAINLDPKNQALGLIKNGAQEKTNQNQTGLAQSDANSTSSATAAESFSKSELLQTLEQSAALADNDPKHIARLASLKEMVESRSLGILSADPNERLDSAQKISEKLVDFETQLSVLDKE